MRGHSSMRTVLRSRTRMCDTGSFPSRPFLDVRATSSSSTSPAVDLAEDATTGFHPRAAASSAPRHENATTRFSLAEPSLLLGKHQPRTRGRRQPETDVTHHQSRHFHSEAEYHRIADGTLHALQDAIDEAFERYDDENENDDNGAVAAAATPPEYELNVASGVLTLALPGRGTWVLNKQTPNQQIWWSSPLSGPKRFEFIEGAWCSTKDGLTLGPLLAQELRHVHPRLDVDLTNV